MESFLSVDAITGFLTLTAMEIILGIDNVIFIAILVSRLPEKKRPKARTMGLGLAFLTRLLLLLSISWIMGLQTPWFSILGRDISGRDAVLLVGGLFLIGKATFEIHHKIEGDEEIAGTAGARSFVKILVQIALLDIVFSLDSVITAVGMVDEILVMVAAVMVSMVVMLAASSWITHFIERNPTIKILALSFLILIGVMLVFEGGGGHMPKAYVYFAMAFSLGVELLNIRYRKKISSPRSG